MEMPYKYTTENTIRRLEEELSVINQSIGRAKMISIGDKEGFDVLREQIKDFMITARDKKNNALDFLERDQSKNFFSSDMQQKLAYICRGQEKAFEIILDLMENPQSSISFYEQERTMIEEDLKKYKSYEQRPD